MMLATKRGEVALLELARWMKGCRASKALTCDCSIDAVNDDGTWLRPVERVMMAKSDVEKHSSETPTET